MRVRSRRGETSGGAKGCHIEIKRIRANTILGEIQLVL